MKFAALASALVVILFLTLCNGQLALTDDAEKSFADADASLSWENDDDITAEENDEDCDARVAEAEGRVEDVLRQVTAFMAVADEKYLKAYTDMKEEYTKFMKAVSNLPSSNVRYVVQPSECTEPKTTITLAPTTTTRKYVTRKPRRNGEPLISGKVHHVVDASLTASSSKDEFSPMCSRLVTPITKGCHSMVWVAGEQDKHPWIQADLGGMYTVVAVVTDGHVDKENPNKPEWVSKFTVAYKIGDRWRHIEYGHNRHIKREYHTWFHATHRYPRTHKFGREQFNTTAVRIYPTKCEHACALRWEVKGYPVAATKL